MATSVPVRAHEPNPAERRIVALDILRGFAICGVIAANFGYSFKAAGTTVDHVVHSLLNVLVDGAFYPIFCMLFGIGFAIQMERAGANFTGIYLRRLSVLFVIGIAHIILIWWGDILFLYATLGMLLIPARRLPSAWLSAAAGALWALSFFEQPLLLLIGVQQNGRWSTEDLYRRGTYTQVVEMRWRGLPYQLYDALQDPMLLQVLAFLLTGLLIARSGLFKNPRGFPLRKAAALFFAVGIVVRTGLEFTEWQRGEWSRMIVRSAAGLALSCAYSCAALLIARAGRLHALANIGRMALTNYIVEALVRTTVLYGYGFGLQRVAPAAGLALIAAIIGFELWFSRWWLRRYRFGPLEWLWRSATYARWQSVRIPAGP